MCCLRLVRSLFSLVWFVLVLVVYGLLVGACYVVFVVCSWLCAVYCVLRIMCCLLFVLMCVVVDWRRVMFVVCSL